MTPVRTKQVTTPLDGDASGSGLLTSVDLLEPGVEVGDEPLRGEMEARGDDGEDAESDELDRQADERDVLSRCRLVLVVGVTRVESGYGGGTNGLHDQTDDVEGHEDWREPTS